jgi:hypothetical protein
MENGFWMYKVTWYFDGEIRHNQGFICADTFSEAAAKVENAYDDVQDIYIVGLDAYNVLDFEDILDMMGALTEGSTLGPQLIAAIQDAIAVDHEAQ